MEVNLLIVLTDGKYRIIKMNRVIERLDNIDGIHRARRHIIQPRQGPYTKYDDVEMVKIFF